ncbi:ATP-binding protein [Klebsiella pneumoniae]|uniref:ATP-binding protein n=1 Tax=Klebsiella pneumoniae TaxID=573 RepID=UPI00388E6997
MLFLDELPEFERRVLDALREPTLSQARSTYHARAPYHYPARFQLIAAMNPSPTGHYQVNIIVHRRSRHCATLTPVRLPSSTASIFP